MPSATSTQTAPRRWRSRTANLKQQMPTTHAEAKATATPATAPATTASDHRPVLIGKCLRLRAQRQPQTYLPLPLHYGISHNPVDSQSRQQQSTDGEQQRQLHLETPLAAESRRHHQACAVRVQASGPRSRWPSHGVRDHRRVLTVRTRRPAFVSLRYHTAYTPSSGPV